MYEQHFAFAKRPFPAYPLPDYYFETENTRRCRETLGRVVRRAEGPGILIGPPGTGKTLLLQKLQEQLVSEFSVVTFSGVQADSRRALLQLILFALKLPYRDREVAELRLTLVDYLQRGEGGEGGPATALVVLVDEAHALDVEQLAELREFVNLVHAGEPRVRLVLAGHASLEERFAVPRLDSFNQQIAARCYLQPLNREETAALVSHQLRVAGGPQTAETIFTGNALHTIYQATDGLPRLINQLCDQSLVHAAEAGRREIDASEVSHAWSELQQLPAPWQSERTAQDSSFIEFGELDEDEPVNTVPGTPTEELPTPQDPAAAQRSADPTTRNEELEMGRRIPGGIEVWTLNQPSAPGNPLPVGEDYALAESSADESHHTDEQIGIHRQIELQQEASVVPNRDVRELPVEVEGESSAGAQSANSPVPLDGLNAEDPAAECETRTSESWLDRCQLEPPASARPDCVEQRESAADYQAGHGVAGDGGDDAREDGADGRLVEDPFGEFDEEEVVIDRFLDGDVGDRVRGPQVTGRESQILAAAFAARLAGETPTANSAAREPREESWPVSAPAERAIVDAATAVQMANFAAPEPEEVHEEEFGADTVVEFCQTARRQAGPGGAAAQGVPRSQHADHPVTEETATAIPFADYARPQGGQAIAPPDDRDMIVVEDDDATETPSSLKRYDDLLRQLRESN